jgi:hypothetical protein
MNAEQILRNLHFEVFNAVMAIGNSRKRSFQAALRGLRMIERAIEHLTGTQFVNV